MTKIVYIWLVVMIKVFTSALQLYLSDPIKMMVNSNSNVKTVYLHLFYLKGYVHDNVCSMIVSSLVLVFSQEFPYFWQSCFATTIE